MKLLHIVAIGGLLACGSANAQSANMVGYGLSTCRDVFALSAQTRDRTLEIMSWAFGYMSGLNTASIVDRKQYRDIGAVVKNGAAGALTVPLLLHCRDNPNQSFADAVGQFYSKLPMRDFK